MKIIKLTFGILFGLQAVCGFSQNYIPVRPDAHRYYLTHTGPDEIDRYYVNTDFNQIDTLNGVIKLSPYAAPTIRNNDNCYWFMGNSWLGKNISLDMVNKIAVFTYKQVANNLLEGDRQLVLRYGAGLNDSWIADSDNDIVATVIRIEMGSIEGTVDSLKYIRLSHNKGDLFDWQDTEIIIGQKTGLHLFPNLQFFPYRYVRTELKGSDSPLFGVEEYSGEDIFKMNRGDILQTVKTYWFYEPNAGTSYYLYQQKECLDVLAAGIGHQIRRLKVDSYLRVFPATEYTKTTETIIDTVYFSTFDPRSDHLYFSPLTHVRMGEDLIKVFDRTVPDEPRFDECLSQILDVCIRDYTFKHALDIYYECDRIFNVQYDHYKPIYIKHAGIEWGEKINMDKLATREITKTDTDIYPNPTSGEFYLSTGDDLLISTMTATDINGKDYSVEILGSGRYSLKAPAGVYMLRAGDHTGKSLPVGKIILLE